MMQAHEAIPSKAFLIGLFTAAIVCCNDSSETNVLDSEGIHHRHVQER